MQISLINNLAVSWVFVQMPIIIIFTLTTSFIETDSTFMCNYDFKRFIVAKVLFCSFPRLWNVRVCSDTSRWVCCYLHRLFVRSQCSHYLQFSHMLMIVLFSVFSVAGKIFFSLVIQFAFEVRESESEWKAGRRKNEWIIARYRNSRDFFLFFPSHVLPSTLFGFLITLHQCWIS